MIADGPLGEHQRSGDLPVRPSLRDQVGDLALARGERAAVPGEQPATRRVPTSQVDGAELAGRLDIDPGRAGAATSGECPAWRPSPLADQVGRGLVREPTQHEPRDVGAAEQVGAHPIPPGPRLADPPGGAHDDRDAGPQQPVQHEEGGLVGPLDVVPRPGGPHR